MTPILSSTPLKSLSPARLTSAEPELDSVGTARIAPVDRVLPDVLAHDRTGAELDAPFRVVDESALLQVVDLRGTHVQARLRLARATHVRVDRDERLLVKLEPVEAHALVHGQGLRSVRLRGFRHEGHRRNREPVIKGWWAVEVATLSAEATRGEPSIGGVRHRRARPAQFGDGKGSPHARA